MVSEMPFDVNFEQMLWWYLDHPDTFEAGARLTVPVSSEFWFFRLRKGRGATPVEHPGHRPSMVPDSFQGASPEGGGAEQFRHRGREAVGAVERRVERGVALRRRRRLGGRSRATAGRVCVIAKAGRVEKNEMAATVDAVLGVGAEDGHAWRVAGFQNLEKM
jgi:hypothetical protein